MKKTTREEGRRCPKCGSEENQANFGFNRSGTRRIMCKDCRKTYTMNAKSRAYSEEIRNIAIKTYYSGVSGRGVGKILGMSKANVYNWIKKTGHSGVDK
jgi:transposase-like protein